MKRYSFHLNPCHKATLALLASVFCLPLSYGAQSTDELVEMALAKNPELRLYEAQVDRARGERLQSGKWKNPELSLEAGYRQNRELSGDNSLEEGYSFGVSLVQTFEFPGKASLRKAIADRDVRVAELSLAQFRLSLSGKVRQLAARYRAAVELADLTAQINGRSSDLIKLLQERPLAGARPLLEMRVIQASQAELTEAAKDAAIMRDDALMELNILLGRRPTQSITISSQGSRTERDLPTLEKLLALSFERNLQLKIREAELDQSGLSLDAAKLAAAPDFSIGPFFSRERVSEEETTIGASVAMELPIWDQNQGNIVSARALKMARQAQLVLAQRELERELTTRWNVYQAASRQMGQLRPETLDELHAAAELADRQYRQGAIDVQLYLESQRALLNTKEIINRAVLQLGDTLLDLELLTGGSLPAETNQENEL